MSDDALRASETASSVQRTVLRFKFVAEAEVTRVVTCYPFYSIGAAPKRLIVHAEMVPALPS